MQRRVSLWTAFAHFASGDARPQARYPPSGYD
jgi:hypothetical protein